MKNILLIAIIAFSINAKAQITLEHKYDSASTEGSFSDQLMIIKFEVSGERYVKVNRQGKRISIYDMNHSFVKSISLASVPLDAGSIGEVLYLSETLFDTDPAMEFMYYKGSCTATPYELTQIYKEDGTLIFQDTSGAWIRNNFEQQQLPIYNTPVGTKMILSHSNDQAWVFSLPGTLTTGIQNGNLQMLQAQSGNISNLYPNPSNGAVTLQYDLPKGERGGELILYNTQGAEVKRYKVDDTFTDVILDNTQLPAGTYFYQLQTSKGAVGTKKMVVVK